MSYTSMTQAMMEMLVTKLNLDLAKADYRPFWTEKTEGSADVECTIKFMLGRMMPQGIGHNEKFDHTGWVYFDFGSNDERAALQVSQAIDELLDWIATNYTIGTGFTYGGTTIRDLKHVPFQGYSQPRDSFWHDMIMCEFWWERN